MRLLTVVYRLVVRRLICATILILMSHLPGDYESFETAFFGAVASDEQIGLLTNVASELVCEADFTAERRSLIAVTDESRRTTIGYFALLTQHSSENPEYPKTAFSVLDATDENELLRLEYNTDGLLMTSVLNTSKSDLVYRLFDIVQERLEVGPIAELVANTREMIENIRLNTTIQYCRPSESNLRNSGLVQTIVTDSKNTIHIQRTIKVDIDEQDSIIVVKDEFLDQVENGLESTSAITLCLTGSPDSTHYYFEWSEKDCQLTKYVPSKDSRFKDEKPETTSKDQPTLDESQLFAPRAKDVTHITNVIISRLGIAPEEFDEALSRLLEES